MSRYTVHHSFPPTSPLNGDCTTYLEEGGGLAAHAAVQVRLATLDVVVEVGAELVDQVYRVLAVGGVRVAREQHKRYKPGDY